MPHQATAPAITRTRRGYDAGDIDDLLSLVTSAKPEAPAPPVPTAAQLKLADISDITSAPPSRNDIFKRYLAYEDAISAASAAQASIEREAFGFSLTSRPRTEGIEDVAKQAIKMMVHEAQNQFSNRYTTLSIQASDVLAATGQENWELAWQPTSSRGRRGEPSVPAPPRPSIPVDLDKIWIYLEDIYGGEAGQIALYKQLAPMLINRLHLNDKDMRRTANAVIAYQSVRASPFSYGSKTGPYKIYERREVNEVFDALSHVFEWSRLDTLSLALKPDLHRIGEYEFKYDVRDKFSFPGLEIVAMKSSWDYKFSHDAAAKLQLFLGTFGA